MPYFIIYFPTLRQWIQAVPNAQVPNREKYVLISSVTQQKIKPMQSKTA